MSEILHAWCMYVVELSCVHKIRFLMFLYIACFRRLVFVVFVISEASDCVLCYDESICTDTSNLLLTLVMKLLEYFLFLKRFHKRFCKRRE